MTALLIALRIILATCVAVSPFFFGKELEAHSTRYVAAFVAAVALLAAVEIIYERRTSAEHELQRQRAAEEIRRMQQRLELQKARGLALSQLLELMRPLILLAEAPVAFSSEQRKSGLQQFSVAARTILQGVCGEVRGFYGIQDRSRVNASLMRAYRTDNCPADVAKRVQFLGFRRELPSYKYVLDVTAWAEDDPRFPPISIPVEDPDDDDSKDHLLPGAPKAFALGQHQVLSNLDIMSLPGHAGSEVERKVLEAQAEYFHSKGIRSMASLVVGHQTPVGVLNIQSEEADLFGADASVLLGNIDHYRYCLQYVLNGQRQLEADASI